VTTSKRGVNSLIYRARIARLATADSEAKPHVVPVVFAFDGEKYYIPIDEKPKTAKPDKLKRIENIGVNPAVALLIDEYSEDWKKLLFIMIQGKAAIVGKKKMKDKGGDLDCKLLKIAHKLLYKKYPQYQHIDIGRLGIVIYPQKTIFWGMVPENHS
jgi:PPOX class probable F420-dependent enzyme